MMKKLFFFLLTLLPVAGFAQSQGALYQLHRSIPQASELNPALRPDFKFILSLPSAYVYANSPVSLNDAVNFTDDGAELNETGLYNRMKKFNEAKASMDASLLFLGIRGAHSYLSVNINTKVHMNAGVSSDLVGWGLFGPADSRNNGTLDFNGTGINALVYNEIGLGYSRQIDYKLTVGARIKYIQGLANIATDMDMQVHMNGDSISVVNNGINIQAAGASYFVDPDPESFGFEMRDVNYGINEAKDLLMNGNRGFGLDLGATYQFTHELMFSASIKDLGYINWTDYTTDFYTDPSVFTFKGFEASSIEDVEDQMATYTETVTDSLLEMYTLKEKEAATFRTFLPTTIYLGAEYQLGKNHRVSGLFHSKIWNGNWNPALSLAYNLQLGKYFNTVVNWSMANGKFLNAGAGFSLRLLGIQMYMVSDNLFTPLVSLKNTTSADVRFGLNLAIGYKR